MTPRKAPKPKKLLPKLKSFFEALSERCHRALQVIDEALASENLKDKIWAVDWIFKRLPTASTTEDEQNEAEASAKKAPKTPNLSELQAMEDPELLNRIRGYLKDWEPD